MEHKKIKCTCGKDARIVESGVGVYIHCPYCDKCTYMQNTVADALKLWQEITEDNNTGGSMENNIKFIKIENLYPHPDNPRKNLGDLSELVESIKKNGIMQNLTVIPGHYLTGDKWVDVGYTLLIGHRRCAAAKKAGIDKAPCRIIEDMTKKEQVSTMLEENMQRHDLTVYEQAQGFQMMLDLGETEESIAEKTGFSKTTVKHRVNLAKLDQNLLKKKVSDEGFQLSITDMYELEKIESIDIRNKVLANAADSNNLKWLIKREQINEQKMNTKKALIELCEKKGIKEAPKGTVNRLYYVGTKQLANFYLENLTVPEDINISEPDAMWCATDYYFYIVKFVEEKKETSEPKEAKKDDTKKDDTPIIREKIDNMKKRCKSFVKSIIDGEVSINKSSHSLYKDAIWRVLICEEMWIGVGDFEDFLSDFMNEDDYESPEEFDKALQEKVDSLSIFQEYLILLEKTIDDMSYPVECYGKYREKEGQNLIEAFGILEDMGWSFEDDELDILNGTSELYVKGDK